MSRKKIVGRGLYVGTFAPIAPDVVIQGYPSVSGNLVYDGTEQYPSSWNNLNPDQLIYEQVGHTDAGSYETVFTPRPGFVWSDGTQTPYHVAWSIAKATPIVTAPTARELTYTNEAQALVNAGSTTGGTLQYSLDEANWSTDIPVGTDAGAYAVYYRVVGDQNWNDVASASVSATIAKASWQLSLAPSTLSMEPGNEETITITTDYDGEVAVTSSDESVLTVAKSGQTITVSSVDVGSAYVEASISGDTNHNSTTARTNVSVTPSAIVISTPSQRGTLTYNGSAQTPSWNNYDPAEMTLVVEPQINAGWYAATATPNEGYCWLDKTTISKNISWAIEKANPVVTPPVPRTGLVYTGGPQALYTSGTTTGGKIYHYIKLPNGRGVATDSREPIEKTDAGDYTLSYYVKGDNNYKDVKGTDPSFRPEGYIFVGIITIAENTNPIAYTSAQSGVTYTNGLSGLTDAEISDIAKAISNNGSITNTTTEVWVSVYNRHISIGDQISYTLNGASYPFRVMGFNHYQLADSTAYGEATVTGKAGILLQMVNLWSSRRFIVSSGAYYGNSGWRNASSRTYLNNDVLGFFSNSAQDAIKQVDVYSATSVTSSTLVTTQDKLFLPSEMEIYGTTKYSINADGEGTQYSWYRVHNSDADHVKLYNNSANSWWTRSAYRYDSNGSYIYFFYVPSNGKQSGPGSSSSTTLGLSPCFCY